MPNITEGTLIPYDVLALFKAIIQIRAQFHARTSNESLSEGLFDRFKTRKKQKNEVELDDLYNTWEEQGSPVDTNEIISILKYYKFTNGEIKKAFSTIGMKSSDTSDPKITKLSSAIVKAGFANEVASYLDSLTESVLTERPLANKDIKSLFSAVVSKIESTDEDIDLSDETQLIEFFTEFQNKILKDV